MPTRKNATSSPFPHGEAKRCESSGCGEAGLYRAPKSRDSLYEYVWFCLDHVKEYNRKWDYFSDMGQEEIEGFMKEAVTGHRPTWEREAHMRAGHYAERLREEIRRFFGQKPASPGPQVKNPKERKALKALEINAPAGREEVKAQYRVLVKQYHPDLHRGDKTYEDKFKEITAAYAYLMELYAPR